MTSADRTDPISLRRLRLPRLKLSRRVRFTNRFTERDIDLQFLHPSAPFPSCHRRARHRVRTRQATASGAASTRDTSPPVVLDAKPRRVPVVITPTGSALGHRPHCCLSTPLPRTRLLPTRVRNHAPLARRCRGVRKLGSAPLVCADRSWPGFSGGGGLAAGRTEGAQLCWRAARRQRLPMDCSRP